MHPLKHKDIKQPHSMILSVYCAAVFLFLNRHVDFYGRQDFVLSVIYSDDRILSIRLLLPVKAGSFSLPVLPLPGHTDGGLQAESSMALIFNHACLLPISFNWS